MRKPSRLMPKYSPRPTSIFAWALLLSIGAISIAGLWHEPRILFLLIPITLVSYVSTRRATARLRILAASRKGESLCEFTRSFEKRSIDTWVVRAVYEELQDYLGHSVKDFPLRSSDGLVTDLELDSEDLDMDIAEAIAQRTGRSMETAEKNPYFGKVQTVGDLVGFFNAQPKD